MAKYSILALNKNRKITEFPYLFSRTFNLYFYQKKLRRDFFSFKNGNKIFGGQTYKSVWRSDSCIGNKEKSLYLALILKKKSFKKKIWDYDFIEIWEYSEKNKLKCKSLLYFKDVELWDLKWKNNFSKKKSLGAIVVCCGFVVKVLEIPKFIPFYLEVDSCSLNINIINIFHWVINWSCCEIVAGDINGQLIFYKFKKRLSIKQILPAAHKNSPIGALMNFFGNESSKSKFLVTGGFDGYVKLWHLNVQIKPIVQINFSSCRILDLDFFSKKFGTLGIIIGLDNGFFSIVSFTDEIVVSLQFSHQGSTTGLKTDKNIFFTTGEDGDLVLLEYNLPFFKKTTSCLFFCHKLAINLKLKPKVSNVCFQTTNRRFCITTCASDFIGMNKYILNITGNSGVIIFYSFSLEDNSDFIV